MTEYQNEKHLYGYFRQRLGQGDINYGNYKTRLWYIGGGTPFLEIGTSSQGGGYVFTRLISYNNGTPTVQEYYVNSSSGTPITGQYIKVLGDRKIQAVVACKCLSENWDGSVTIANYSAGDYIISSPSSSGNIVVVLEA